MRADQIAAQLYTVREFLKTPAEVAAALKKIKAIGYAGVELASVGAIPEAELAVMLKDAGLVCASSHESGATILDDPQAIICRLQTLGCTRVACSGPSMKLDSLDTVRRFAQGLSASGKVMKEAGIALSYHNHSHEFRRLDGKLILETIYAESDPQYLGGQLDTYWVQHGGGDTEDWCRGLKGRLPSIHVKDYGISEENQPTFFEIGYGNLTWKPIIAACDDAGCEWFIVEQDRCARDPFESLQMSFEYMRDHLCR